MAEPKTQLTSASVEKFIAAQPEPRRSECRIVADMMRKAVKADPHMWGSSIIGFGTQSYVYASGRTGDWPALAFAPRKAALVLYLSMGGGGVPADLLKRLGKHKMGKGCLYVNKLADVDTKVLQQLIVASANVRRAVVPASKAAKQHVAAATAAKAAGKRPAAKRPAKPDGRQAAARTAAKKPPAARRS